MQKGVADLGMSGREPVLMEYLSFDAAFHADPCELAVATGSYDQQNYTWTVVIFVHKDNPLAKFTLEQLDGIFGSERTGVLKGIKWLPEYARNADKNIRTWGQLGLSGEWADKPIQTYGLAFTGTCMELPGPAFRMRP